MLTCPTKLPTLANTMARWSHCPHLPVPGVVFLLACLSLTSSSHLPNSSFPVPDTHFTHAQYLVKRDLHYHSETYPSLHSPNPDLYSERLDVDVSESDPTWLDIQWEVKNRRGAKVGVLRFSRVQCYVGNSTILSHVINDSSNQFRIANLSANTEYVVCVETIEKSDNYVHYKCMLFRTNDFPLVRPDSILGLILSLGYIFVMTMIGFITWCMRVRKYVNKHKNENELELSGRTSTVRVSEIEERSRLNHPPVT